MHEEGASVDCLTRVMNKMRTRKGLVCKLWKKMMRNLIPKNKLNIKFIKNVIKTTTMNITILIGLFALFLYLLFNQNSVNTLNQNIFKPLYTTLNDLFMTLK